MKNTQFSNYDEIKLSSGMEFEAEFAQVTYEHYRGKYTVVTKATFRKSTQEEDRCNGVDFFAEGVPVDTTLTIETKDHCKLSSKVLKMGGYEVKFGFRTGNNHRDMDKKGDYHKFEEPVLVIGITGIVMSHLVNAMEIIGKNIGKIIETGTDYYWNEYDLLDEAV